MRYAKLHSGRHFRLFVKLGFVINLKKSVLVPGQISEYLGYILNTIQLAVTLPRDKIERFRDFANFVLFLSRSYCKIREVAMLLCLMTSYTTAMRFGRLFTHHLEIQKIDPLKEADDNYNGLMTLDVTSRDDITRNWWIAHLDSEFAYMKHLSLQSLCAQMPASMAGGGGGGGESHCGRQFYWREMERN